MTEDTAIVVNPSTHPITGPTDSTYTGDIVIPATVTHEDKTYTVTKIGKAFGIQYPKDATLTSVTLPDTITEISGGAFNNCAALTSLNIPSSVTTIGSGAFNGCSALETLTIPASVKDGVYEAFYSLSGSYPNAKNVVFADGSPYANVSGVLYKGTELLSALDDQITSVNVREGTTAIGDGAFYMCTELAEVTLPEGLLTIGDDAFNYAPRVDINIPSIPGIPGGVTVVGGTPADALEYINIPSTVRSIGNNFLKGALKNDGSSVIIMQGTTPPTFGSGLFMSKPDSPYTANIYYPAEASDAYAASSLGSYIDKPSEGGDTPSLGYALSLPTTASVTVGSTSALNVDATVPSGATLTWASSNDSIATVNNGTVTGVAAGTATITARIMLGDVELTSATCTVTVTARTPDDDGPDIDVPDTYPITVADTANGSVDVSYSNASKGSVITVTVAPDEGFIVGSVSVTGEDGAVEVTRVNSTTYSFVMPESAVTVSVNFVSGSAGFVDVPAGAWYSDAVAYVYANGLMQGTSATTFEPDAGLTRSMVWAVLARMDGETVSGTGWQSVARAWAVRSGVSDGTDPNGLITREQLVTMLWRFAGEPTTDATLSGYSDAASVNAWATTAMAWAIDNGIITGVTDTTLVPQGTATRAQCAAILMRYDTL